MSTLQVRCMNCGALQPDGAVFCDECGAKLAAAPPPSPPSVPAPGAGKGQTRIAARCAVCGHTLVAGEAFCERCGAAVKPSAPPPPATRPSCPRCGAELQPNSRFCDMCGAPSPAPAPPPPPLTGVPGKLIVQGSNVPLPFPPGRTEVIVGREDPVSNIFPDIDLTEHGGEAGGVSRRHARIFLRGNQVLVEDLNSTNRTYVNRQKLTPGQPHPLKNGDEVRFGRVKLIYAV